MISHNGKFNEFRGFEESLSLRHLFRENLDLYVSHTTAWRLSSISPDLQAISTVCMAIYGCERDDTSNLLLLHMIWIDQHI
jgi:hypothetical protein